MPSDQRYVDIFTCAQSVRVSVHFKTNTVIYIVLSVVAWLFRCYTCNLVLLCIIINKS